jgi:hypothetical protein
MPDLDVLGFHAAPGWGTPFRLLKGTVEPRVLARAVVQASARTLRKHGGIPGLDSFSETIRGFDANEFDLASALAANRRKSLSLGGRHAAIVERACNRVLVERHNAGARVLDPKGALVSEFLREFASHHLFDRARPVVVRPGKLSEAAYHEYASRCAAELEGPFSRMATALLRDPRASSLRAPKSDSPRTSTAVLLKTRLN